MARTIAYLRVSTGGQTTDNQKLAIFNAGYQPDEWFEISASATKSIQDRKLDKLMKDLQPGDLLIVTELSRLGRSISQVISTVDALVKRRIRLHSLKESIKIDSDKMDMQSKVLVTLISLFSEIERDLISERTKEGLARVKATGKKLGRRVGSKYHVLDGREQEVKEMADKGLSISALAKVFDVTRASMDHFVKTRDLMPK